MKESPRPWRFERFGLGVCSIFDANGRCIIHHCDVRNDRKQVEQDYKFIVKAVNAFDGSDSTSG